MHIDPEECKRLAASCQRLAKTAPTSFLAAELGELSKKWLEVANELEELQIAVQACNKASEKKRGAG
jgi:hypothetical protein